MFQLTPYAGLVETKKFATLNDFFSKTKLSKQTLIGLQHSPHFCLSNAATDLKIKAAQAEWRPKTKTLFQLTPVSHIHRRTHKLCAYTSTESCTNFV